MCTPRRKVMTFIIFIYSGKTKGLGKSRSPTRRFSAFNFNYHSIGTYIDYVINRTYYIITRIKITTWTCVGNKNKNIKKNSITPIFTSRCRCRLILFTKLNKVIRYKSSINILMRVYYNINYSDDDNNNNYSIKMNWKIIKCYIVATWCIYIGNIIIIQGNLKGNK